MSGILSGEKLIEVINSADESTVRAVLCGLCTEKRVEKLVGKNLYEVTKLNAVKRVIAGFKRKAMAPVHICVRCGQAFDEDDNKMKQRLFHPEKMGLDDEADVWADWDENAHGEMDTPENRHDPNLLEGFIYYCCDKQADESNGCKLGYHRAVDGKRGKYGVDDDAIDVEEEKEEEDEDDEEEENE